MKKHEDNDDNNSVELETVEILGGYLRQFFENLRYIGRGKIECTYNSQRYQVWSVPKNTFNAMCLMSEEAFQELAETNNAWWRYCEGSVLGPVTTTKNVNHHKLKCWKGSMGLTDSYESLTSYLCDCVGASTGKNVCACAMDLAKYNNMTLGELFNKYEPIENDIF